MFQFGIYFDTKETSISIKRHKTFVLILMVINQFIHYVVDEKVCGSVKKNETNWAWKTDTGKKNQRTW